MTKAVVGKWGKSLAVRVPADVARAVGISDGEPVDIEKIGDTIVIRREGLSAAQRLSGERAAAKIREARKGIRLDGISIRELIDEGRR